MSVLVWKEADSGSFEKGVARQEPRESSPKYLLDRKRLFFFFILCSALLTMFLYRLLRCYTTSRERENI